MSNDWRARGRRDARAASGGIGPRGDVEDLRRPEVIACIMISHNGGFDQPVDASEEICLKQMISRLTELGVGPGN